MKTEEELKSENIKKLIVSLLSKKQFCDDYNEETLQKYNEQFKDCNYWGQIGNIKIINDEFNIPDNVNFLLTAAQYVYNTGNVIKSTIKDTKEEIYDVLENNNALFMIMELLDYSPSKYMIRFANIPKEDIEIIKNMQLELDTLLGGKI